MSGRHRKCIAAASYPVLASIALVAGCTELPPFDQLLPADLDPSLAYVYNHADSFAQARDDPLSDVTAGTVKEDLESLSGCWGAYVADVAKGDAPIRVDEYDLLVFEAETHRLTAWNLENYGGLAPIVVEQSGNYAITHGSRIEFTITLMRAYNPLSRQYDTFTPSADGSMPPSFQWPATLSQGHLKLAMGDSDSAPGSADLVYTRFDCAH